MIWVIFSWKTNNTNKIFLIEHLRLNLEQVVTAANSAFKVAVYFIGV